MKKVLCLVIVLVFCFNLTAIALSNDETEKLKDFGIMVGDPDGEMRLDDFVTVGEASKMICVMMGVNDVSNTILPENYPLSYDNWASKYIYFMELTKLVELPENAENYQESFISADDAVKMILKPLGYLDSLKDKNTAECLKLSAQLGITKGVSLVTGDNITRKDMAKLLVNSLNVPIMAMTGFDAKTGEGSYKVLDGKNGTSFETVETRLKGNK